MVFLGHFKDERAWHEDTKCLIVFWIAPKELCDQFAECGAYGNCNPNSGNQYQCSCFSGYNLIKIYLYFYVFANIHCEAGRDAESYLVPYSLTHSINFHVFYHLNRYQPKSPQDWYLRDGLQGCIREDNRSMCRNGEGFLKLSNVKLPDTSKAIVNKTATLQECREACLRNCSCTGYTVADASGAGSGCISFYQQLTDVIMYPNQG